MICIVKIRRRPKKSLIREAIYLGKQQQPTQRRGGSGVWVKKPMHKSSFFSTYFTTHLLTAVCGGGKLAWQPDARKKWT
jgi:hypothetical protein